ncbi:MAG: hypothetical protein WAV88_05400, partial [Candidatus Nanopelagicales bacterium]
HYRTPLAIDLEGDLDAAVIGLHWNLLDWVRWLLTLAVVHHSLSTRTHDGGPGSLRDPDPPSCVGVRAD